MLDGSRVTILVRPLDRTLWLLRLAFVPLMALALNASAITALGSSTSDGRSQILLTIVGPLLAVVYVVSLQTHAVGRRVDRFVSRTRRYVARSCDHGYAASVHRPQLACSLTTSVFRAPLFQYEQQQRVVNLLVDSCSKSTAGQYWFVEGASGSGKTRTALHFIQELARDKDLYELSNRCYLYDLAESSAVQGRLLKKVGSKRHEDAVVLIDNFQLVGADLLHRLTEQLLDRAGLNCERIVVILARQSDAWSLGKDSDVRLRSVATESGRYLKLSGPGPGAILAGVARFAPNATPLVQELRRHGLATAAQLHIGQVIARCRHVPAKVAAVAGMLTDQASDEVNPRLCELLASIVGLSIHRGTFTRWELYRSVLVASGGCRRFRRLFHIGKLCFDFQSLHRVGFVPHINVTGRRYIFHEAIAEDCVDRLGSLPAFYEQLARVVTLRLNKARENKDPVGAWLLSVEIDKEDVMASTFESALACSAYARMVGCLDRASRRRDLSAIERFQFAIVLDRSGAFAESRAQFETVTAADLAESPDLLLMLAASRLEANHFNNYEDNLATLHASSDPVVRCIARYWDVHIESHHGVFGLESLLAIAQETRQLLTDRTSSWQRHFLARMHFDSMRDEYLSGTARVETIDSARREDINLYLKKYLPTYEALNVLYTKAHMVGHVLLPRLALFNEPVDDTAVAHVGLNEDMARSAAGLAVEAERLYRRARDEFWQYGDKEAEYLQADILNSEMIQQGADLEKIASRLRGYSDFIAAGDRKVLAGYPHFYYFRMNLLKYYRLVDLGIQHLSAADTCLEEAERHLESVLSASEEVSNEYGIARARLLLLVLRGVGRSLDYAELDGLGREMRARAYEFEAELLWRMSRKAPYDPPELRSIVRYYPFVHQ